MNGRSLLKKILFIAAFSTAPVVSAYTIGGAYASLDSCSWGQYGYEYGYIGTYNVNGKTYQVFFGNSYCKY